MDRKNKKLNLLKKAEIADKISERELKVSEATRIFNISKSCATNIINNLIALTRLDKTDPNLRKRYNLSSCEEKYFELDMFLKEKITNLRKKSIPVNKKVIKEIASLFYEERNINNAEVTEFYINNFLKREKLTYVKLHGESASADLTQIATFKSHIKIKLTEFSLKDIFNIDETGLYIKEASNKSYVFNKTIDNKNVKKNKTRVTLMLGCNPFGEWLVPLLIGKSNKPRIFKNVNLKDYNILYRANQSSWLTKNLFDEYLTILNESLKKECRKILLLCDNFSGHIVGNKSNIELLFLPPNCTSVIQPLDMGIINSFKTKFKQMLTNFQVVEALTHNADQTEGLKKITLLDVILWIKKSINLIKIETIENCWKKSTLFDLECVDEDGCKELTIDVNVNSDIEEEEQEVAFERVVAINTDICEDLNYSRAVRVLKEAFEILKENNSAFLQDIHNLIDNVNEEYLEKNYEGTLDIYLNKKEFK
ncbi:Tigger transposable element-derived protein 6 [Dictyocoela muelleri]|nr:Tigger transposable element-derived protein 6 [Dictyocoela muelleri]